MMNTSIEVLLKNKYNLHCINSQVASDISDTLGDSSLDNIDIESLPIVIDSFSLELLAAPIYPKFWTRELINLSRGLVRERITIESMETHPVTHVLAIDNKRLNLNCIQSSPGEIIRFLRQLYIPHKNGIVYRNQLNELLLQDYRLVPSTNLVEESFWNSVINHSKVVDIWTCIEKMPKIYNFETKSSESVKKSNLLLAISRGLIPIETEIEGSNLVKKISHASISFNECTGVDLINYLDACRIFPEFTAIHKESKGLHQALKLKPIPAFTLNERYSLFPIQDMEAYTFGKRQEARFWTSAELKFIQDKSDYESLPKNKQRLMDIIIAFFMPGDGLVNNNIIHRYLQNCQTFEDTHMYTFQLAIEMVHAESYGLIAYTLYGEDKMKELQTMADDSPYILAKAKFMEEYTEDSDDEAERLLAFACAEGIFFSVLFANIFWFRSSNIFKNLTFANELISEDETLHRDYAAFRFSKRVGALSLEKALMIVKRAVEIEDAFIDWMLPEPVDDLNAVDMKRYLRLVADNLLVECGYQRYYCQTNPFSWMDDFSMVKKNNFYETKTAAYIRFSVNDAINIEKRAGRDKTSEDAFKNPSLVDF